MDQSERSAAELAAEMLEKLAGFQLSQALYAVAKLDLAAALLDGPRPVGELAALTGVREDSLRRLMHTLTGYGVFRHDSGDSFSVTELGATLAAGTPGSVRGVALFWMETHYAPFAMLTEAVRTGRSGPELLHGQSFFDYLGDHPEHTPALTAAMADMTAGSQSAVLDGYRLPVGNAVADIGGADGSVLASLIADDPGRRGIVLDLPHVVQAAHDRLAQAGLTDRVEVVGGDFFQSVPKADVYLLSTVLHDWDDTACTNILSRIREAAAPGARLVVLEVVMPDGDDPHLGKIADLTMLGMVTGRERTTTEFTNLLGGAGFTVDRIIDGPEGGYSLIEATLR
ncbi:methyltransferase [Saccharopolyspora sp. 5N708]|uniref:methyltransferase n=1 Tax=Saccharopolyspora sp. 5N708 TaxID=3457424 RepID=UPI003FCF25F0